MHARVPFARQMRHTAEAIDGGKSLGVAAAVLSKDRGRESRLSSAPPPSEPYSEAEITAIGVLATADAQASTVSAGCASEGACAKLNAWDQLRKNHYNLVYREEEREMIPLCRAEGIGLIPWSPLARGFLAGNRQSREQGFGPTPRAKTDDFAHRLYYQDSDSRWRQQNGAS